MFRKLLFFTFSLFSLFTVNSLRCDSKEINSLCKSKIVERCYSCRRITTDEERVLDETDYICVPAFTNNYERALEEFSNTEWNCTVYRPYMNLNDMKLEGVNWADYVPIPSDINPGLTSASANYKWMMDTLGSPGCEMSASCFSCSCGVNNKRISSRLTVMDVGPFKVYALAPFAKALKRAFRRVRDENPSLYESVSSAGAMCCRPIKKSDGTPGKYYSNHSWGLAIDIKIYGVLDRRGDGMTQKGLLELSKYMNEEGLWWAAGYVGGAEDAMHFEVSKEALDDWIAKGML